MPACKACGAWFVKIKPHEELCDKCECALCRLSGYVARVTRCKDCKHSWEDLGGLTCSHGVCVDCVVLGDFYCANGERKEGADNG
nr:MAG TPA: RRN7 Zinc-finger of RNA-polymerase I-specific TFIIB, Rrn7 [Caudoviricetes sp.]